MPRTLIDVPDAPKTPRRGVRVPDSLWEQAQAKADRNGETVSEVIRRLLWEWVKQP